MSLRFALIGPISALATAAAADDRVFVTAAGVSVRTPAIAEMTCEDMRGVLRGIDRSNYRRGGASPDAMADQPLYLYENRVWLRYYRDCVLSPEAAEAAASAFLDGFTGSRATPE